MAKAKIVKVSPRTGDELEKAIVPQTGGQTVPPKTTGRKIMIERHGGLAKAKKVFGNQFEAIIEMINEAVAA